MSAREILLVTPRLPYPPVGGDRLRSYHLIDRLSRHANLHLLSLTDQDPDGSARAWLEHHTKSFEVIKQGKARAWSQCLFGMLGNKPLQINYFWNPKVRKRVAKLGRRMDLGLAFLERTASYLLPMDLPKILDFTDSIGQSYQKSLRGTRSLLWRRIYATEIPRLARYEAMCVDRFNRSVFVNQEEMAYFSRPEKTRWIPNGVNEALFQMHIGCPEERAVGFLGKMDYPPNIEAVEFFCREVLPRLGREVKFYIVGTSPSRKVLNLGNANPNVIVTGFLQDPFEVIKRCSALVAPMQTGGGIQNKILEAMAMGQVVITSSLAAKPIAGAEDGRHFLVGDGPDAIADHIRNVLGHPKEFMEMRFNARAFIKTNFTWDLFEERYRHELETLS